MQKKDVISFVKDEFLRRREERRALEAKWLLNLNFLKGNQYSCLNARLELTPTAKQYFWESREVYNHIAPIVESRLAKFTRVNCAVNVRPASADDEDVKSATLATKLLESTFLDNDFYKKFALANLWAEVTGSVFYKVFWKDEGDGEVKISVCPSYEIYPDSLGVSDIDAQRSLIHARAYPVGKIEDIWGVKVESEDVSVVGNNLLSEYQDGAIAPKEHKKEDGYAMVLEYYESPSADHPDGRLIIVGGSELIYQGPLPYLNGENGSRKYPFARQTCIDTPCSFFGSSVIERLIPVQRAYNAVKNRKHEFLSRLSVGVVAVEEGSVDIENLEEEGLAPGKIITYRQGSTPPLMMNPGSVPSEFRDEEDRLLMEFKVISGVSDSADVSSKAEATVSGYALSLLIEQDYMRLSVTTESIRSAVKEVAKQVLRLYREYSFGERILKVAGKLGGVEVDAFKASELRSDDVVMESDSTMVETPATRKSMVLELLKSGLLGDENGIISNRNRSKIIEMLGFGNWEHARSDEEVHLKKSALENAKMASGQKAQVDELDDHALHIIEHGNAFASGAETLSESAKKLIKEHVRRHKVLSKLADQAGA